MTERGIMPDIEQATVKRVKDLHAAIESACEASLATFDCGVLVTHHPDLSWTVEVSIHVPYGHIYEVRA